MAPVTRKAAMDRAKGPREPVRPVLKIKLTAGQVRTTIQLSAEKQQKAAIEKTAAIENQLRQAKEAELQEALTRPAVSRQVSTVDLSPRPTSGSTAGGCSPRSNVGGEEDVGRSEEGTPLVYQFNCLMNDD